MLEKFLISTSLKQGKQENSFASKSGRSAFLHLLSAIFASPWQSFVVLPHFLACPQWCVMKPPACTTMFCSAASCAAEAWNQSLPPAFTLPAVVITSHELLMK